MNGDGASGRVGHGQRLVQQETTQGRNLVSTAFIVRFESELS